MRSPIFRAFVFLLLLNSSQTFAAEYYWTASGVSGQYSSAVAACTAVAGSIGVAGASFSSLEKLGESSFWCKIARPDQPIGTYGPASRQGNSCPPESVYNPATGACDSTNPCAGKTGATQKFTKSGTSGDGYASIVGGFVVAPQSGCFSGCAVSTVDQKCTGRTSGKYTCRGNASFSGQACATSGAGTEVQDNTSNEPKPDPQVIVEDKPCVYSASGDTQTCTSEKSNEKEGQYCGVVNGVKTCVDSKPTKNGISIQTTVKTETKPDGSKVTTKTDIATKTDCTGAGQCSSTSTTTTTTTITDSNGSTTATTGSCTGESCPDKNTNPDGDGDGFGDCTGTDCGEGDGAYGELLKPELGEVDSYQQTTEKFYNRVNNAPLFSAVGNIHAPIVGTAPTLVSAPIAALGGASLDLGFIDELKPILSSILSFVMKAVWCLLALVIFLSA